MNNVQTLNRKFEMIAWGLFFIWWGIADSDFGLLKALPHGLGWLGIGLILLGLNAARTLNGIPSRSFTTILGILAFVLGGLQLARLVLRPPFELPIFAILLIVFGVIVLAETMRRIANERRLSHQV